MPHFGGRTKGLLGFLGGLVRSAPPDIALPEDYVRAVQVVR
jgi:hypothetical protein